MFFCRKCQFDVANFDFKSFKVTNCNLIAKSSIVFKVANCDFKDFYWLLHIATFVISITQKMRWILVFWKFVIFAKPKR